MKKIMRVGVVLLLLSAGVYWVNAAQPRPARTVKQDTMRETASTSDGDGLLKAMHARHGTIAAFQPTNGKLHLFFSPDDQQLGDATALHLAITPDGAEVIEFDRDELMAFVYGRDAPDRELDEAGTVASTPCMECQAVHPECGSSCVACQRQFDQVGQLIGLCCINCQPPGCRVIGSCLQYDVR